MGNEMLMIILSLALLTTKGELTGNIVGGDFAEIEDFPYAVFLTVHTRAENNKMYQHMCGASILNQAILLTAAHCVDEGFKIKAYAGSTSKYSGHVRSVVRYLTHRKYNSFVFKYDIALTKLNRALRLGKHVGRVAVSPEPPYFEKSVVVGWGVTDDEYHSPTEMLKHTNQMVWTHEKCIALIPSLHSGSLCAHGFHNNDHAAGGDSGGALVVRKYMQIGLVSYSMPEVSRTVVVYTDVGYFYYWIQTNAERVFC